jgi:hypothetical protein
MSCNGYNHGNCDCGFGGVSHGKSVWNVVQPHCVKYSPNRRTAEIGTVIHDYCRSTSCPVCGDIVYFVRHNGGSVWFDELGWPWPIHSCMQNNLDAIWSRLRLDNMDKESRLNVGMVTKVDCSVDELFPSFHILGENGVVSALNTTWPYDYSPDICVGSLVKFELIDGSEIGAKEFKAVHDRIIRSDSYYAAKYAKSSSSAIRSDAGIKSFVLIVDSLLYAFSVRVGDGISKLLLESSISSFMCSQKSVCLSGIPLHVHSVWHSTFFETVCSKIQSAMKNKCVQHFEKNTILQASTSKTDKRNNTTEELAHPYLHGHQISWAVLLKLCIKPQRIRDVLKHAVKCGYTSIHFDSDRLPVAIYILGASLVRAIVQKENISRSEMIDRLEEKGVIRLKIFQRTGGDAKVLYDTKNRKLGRSDLESFFSMQHALINADS